MGLAAVALVDVGMMLVNSLFSPAGSLPQGDLCWLREGRSKDRPIAARAFGSSYGGRVSRVSNLANGGASWLRSNTWIPILSSRPFSALAITCSQRKISRP